MKVFYCTLMYVRYNGPEIGPPRQKRQACIFWCEGIFVNIKMFQLLRKADHAVLRARYISLEVTSNPA